MASFTVKLSPSPETVTVQYVTADGTATAPDDYTAANPTTLTFAPGETTKTILIPVNANSPVEPDETFFVRLINPVNATISDAEGSGTIRDETVQRLIRIDDVVVREGDLGAPTQAVLTVSLSRPSSQNVSVNYFTEGATATAPGDFTAVTGTLTFSPGETSRTVTVDIQGDAVEEKSEVFRLKLSNSVNAAVADLSGLVVILDDDLLQPGVFELAALDGRDGFRLNGASVGDLSGSSVSDAGDVNGDGFGDLIVGAPGADPSGRDAGAGYVIFGKAGGFAPDLNLSMLDGSDGFKLSGVAANNRAGNPVSSAGDVNGDGFDDLLIGAPHAEGSGVSYVLFGKAAGFAPNVDLSTLDGTNGFKIPGLAPGKGNQFGTSVSNAGDVNGDGLGDMIIGAPSADPAGYLSGASYVVFGRPGGFPPELNISTLDGTNGFMLSGSAASERSGSSVSTAGDVNGDGLDDLIIGAPFASANNTRAGVSYIVFGRESGFGPKVDLSTLNGDNGFRVSGVSTSDYSGKSVSAAGDVNGDGFDDVIISGNNGDGISPASTASYVVFGKASGFAPDLKVSVLDGTNGFKIRVNAIGTPSVGAAGDFNGDGFDDLLIGARFADPTGPASGASYILFGKGSGFNEYVSLSQLSGLDGYQFNGAAPYDASGTSVSGAGDVNGDGFADVIIGAPQADPNGSESGASYVIFGHGVELNISDASATEGDAGTKGIQFTVSLSEAGVIPTTVNVSAVNGSAAAGSDFTAVGQTQLTFAPGELSKTVTFDVAGDTLFESDETFSVVLSDAKGGVIQDGTGLGTILNDDAAPTVSITDGSILEGHSGTRALTFTVSLSAVSGLPVSVGFSSADGTATAGLDYTALAGTLDFAPGETTKTIAVEVVGDTLVEGSETFSLLLVNTTNALIGDGNAVGSILDDDITLLGARRATYVDVDGDVVTVHVSKGTLKVENFSLVPKGDGARLALVDFSGDVRFADADLRITARAADDPSAIRSARVGFIDAAGIDFGDITIEGSLGRIDAGNRLDPGAGLTSLTANLLGRRAPAAEPLVSQIEGRLGLLQLFEGMGQATLSVNGGIDAIAIAGSLRDSSILSDGRIGTISIGGDVTGSAMNANAAISARGHLAPSGAADALAIGSLAIGGSVP